MTLIHRRNSLRAEKIMQDRLFANPKIDVIWDSVVDEVLGTDEPPAVTGVRIAQRQDRQGERCCTSTGSSSPSATMPATALFRGQLEIDDEGYIVTAARQHGDQRFPACSPPAT